jgi:hypothetical protein
MEVMDTPTTLERAFALARSGTCTSVNDIRLRLKGERFDNVDAHLAGHSIVRQLRALCDEAVLSRRARAGNEAGPATGPERRSRLVAPAA